METYSFEDFARDYDEIYPALHADNTDNFVHAIVFVSDYMDERHEPEVARFRTQRFMLITHYVSAHIEDFDQGDYAVNGSLAVGALISNHLIHAAHEWFTRFSLGETRDPTPQEIMALADTFRGEGDRA